MTNEIDVAMSTARKFLIAACILWGIPLSGMSIDIMAPSLPAISHYFDASKTLTQLTITVFLLGFGVAQLFVGSVVDSVGRKKPLILALSVFILATLLMPRSSNIHQLLLLRFIQGVAVASVNVPMRAILADLFRGRAFMKMVNYMSIAWTMGPILAPAIGGHLQEHFSWHMPCYFLAIYASTTLGLMLVLLPETGTHQHPLKIKRILINYQTMLRYPPYLSGIIMLGAVYSITILFSIVAPFLIQTMLHYSPSQFGTMALLIGLAAFLGNVINRFLINVDANKKVSICLWLSFMVVSGMLFLSLYYPMNIVGILIPTTLLVLLGSIVFPIYFGACIAMFPKLTATANGLMGAGMVIITGISSALGTLLKSNTQIPLVIAYMSLVILGLMLSRRVKLLPLGQDGMEEKKAQISSS